jgi:cytochrome c5
MAISRTQARSEHAAQAGAGHDQFSETIYGVICAACHNYILIDKTNCPSSCREHETCRQAYARF